jgi:hypothetical protein
VFGIAPVATVTYSHPGIVEDTEHELVVVYRHPQPSASHDVAELLEGETLREREDCEHDAPEIRVAPFVTIGVKNHFLLPLFSCLAGARYDERLTGGT